MDLSVPASPAATRVGWIGTGVMGSAMCGHLVAAGWPVTVTSRTRAKADALVAAGARWADDVAGVVDAADVVFTMLGYPSEGQAVLLGEQGVLERARAGLVLVDLSTSRPQLAVEIAEVADSRGAHALDAPVSGGDVGARNATLSIMVGGPSAAFAWVRPLLAHMGTTVVHQGPPGSGQHTKMVNQTLIAGNMIGVCEALLYAYRAGLDIERVLQSVSSGAAGSWSLANLAPRMVAGDMAPGFFVDHFVKDMGIALDEARRLRLALPGLALVQQLYIALQARGRGRDGTQALVHALAAVSGLDWDEVRAGRA